MSQRSQVSRIVPIVSSLWVADIGMYFFIRHKALCQSAICLPSSGNVYMKYLWNICMKYLYAIFVWNVCEIFRSLSSVYFTMSDLFVWKPLHRRQTGEVSLVGDQGQRPNLQQTLFQSVFGSKVFSKRWYILDFLGISRRISKSKSKFATYSSQTLFQSNVGSKSMHIIKLSVCLLKDLSKSSKHFEEEQNV